MRLSGIWNELAKLAVSLGTVAEKDKEDFSLPLFKVPELVPRLTSFNVPLSSWRSWGLQGTSYGAMISRPGAKAGAK